MSHVKLKGKHVTQYSVLQKQKIILYQSIILTGFYEIVSDFFINIVIYHDNNFMEIQLIYI